jgi:hypothetical protein
VIGCNTVRRLSRIWPWTLALLFAAPTMAQPLSHVAVGAPAPEFSLRGADGHTHRLSDYRGKVVVLEWTSPVCPFTAHQYAIGSMQTLQRMAAAQGAVWLSIDTSRPGRPGYVTPAEAKTRVRKLRAKVAAFLFDDGAVGRAYGARATPAMYVIGKDGRVLYDGAYDDDAGGTGVVHHTYVAEVLKDLKTGKAVATPESRQYGCPVEY